MFDCLYSSIVPTKKLTTWCMLSWSFSADERCQSSASLAAMFLICVACSDLKSSIVQGSLNFEILLIDLVIVIGDGGPALAAVMASSAAACSDTRCALFTMWWSLSVWNRHFFSNWSFQVLGMAVVGDCG